MHAEHQSIESMHEKEGIAQGGRCSMIDDDDDDDNDDDDDVRL